MDNFVPSLVSKRTGSFLAIEIDIDNLPDEYKPRWSLLVSKITKKWIENNDFKKPATIWFWGCQSVNFHHPHASWSEFIVPLGFPDTFSQYLIQQLQHVGGTAARLDYLTPRSDWAILYHVENGQVWQQIDTETWEEVIDPKKIKEERKMIRPKSPEEIAGILRQIYKKPFMKKISGDYKISKDILREIIGGRRNLKLANIIENVRLELLEVGYVLVDIEDSVLIFNKKQISRQRKVPRSTVKEYIYVVDDDDCGIVTEADVDEIGKNIHKYIPD